MESPSHHDLTGIPEEEKLKLAVALARRTDRAELGLERLKVRFPGAPDEVLSSGAYHLYSELVSSFVDVLAHIELSLQDPSHAVDEGLLYHPAYHLYNWLQLRALLPWGRHDFLNQLTDVRACLADNDPQGARKLLDTLLQQFGGTASPPMPDSP